MTQNETIISSQPPLYLTVAGQTVRGQNVAQNEDSFALYDDSHAALEEQFGRLYLLADGRGPSGSGAIASSDAIETITKVYYTQSTAQFLMGRLQQAFFAAHERLRTYTQDQDEEQLLTTCTAVVVKGNRCWIAHLGDSRAYLIRREADRYITRLTTDHSLSAAQSRLMFRFLSENNEPHDVLLRALGVAAHRLFHPDFAIVTLRAGDRLLLCSDGLWGALPENTLAEIVLEYTPEQACKHLVEQADTRRGQENISAVVLSLSDVASSVREEEMSA